MTNKNKSVLVWVDSFEEFFQMPLSVWDKFQNSKIFSKLLNVGYSEYYSFEKNNGMKFSPHGTNEIDKLKNKL